MGYLNSTEVKRGIVPAPTASSQAEEVETTSKGSRRICTRCTPSLCSLRITDIETGCPPMHKLLPVRSTSYDWVGARAQTTRECKEACLCSGRFRAEARHLFIIRTSQPLYSSPLCLNRETQRQWYHRRARTHSTLG